MSSRSTRLAFPAIVVASLAANVLTGCGSARRPEPIVGAVDVGSSPHLRLGEQVFMTQCYQCHPNGSSGVGFALNDKPLPRPLIRTQVRQGLGAMPGFDEKRISNEELDALAEYVVALRRQG